MKDQSSPAESGDTPRDETPREKTASGETPREETPRGEAAADAAPRDEAPAGSTGSTDEVEAAAGKEKGGEEKPGPEKDGEETADEKGTAGDEAPAAGAPDDGSQRRDEGAPLGGVRSWRPGKYAVAAMGAAAAVAAAATAFVLTDNDSGTAAMAKSAEPPTVEKLASAVDCKADIQRKVDDYRLGACKTDKTQYTFVTFKDNRAKRGWLDFSKDYGGTYLVGSRWIVVTDKPSRLGPIQGKWGGTVERGADHGQGHGRH